LILGFIGAASYLNTSTKSIMQRLGRGVWRALLPQTVIMVELRPRAVLSLELALVFDREVLSCRIVGIMKQVRP